MKNLGRKTLIAVMATVIPFSTISMADAAEPSLVATDRQSQQMQPLESVSNASETFHRLTVEGYESQTFTYDNDDYTRFKLEDNVYLTLPNFEATSPGNAGGIEVYPSDDFTTYAASLYRPHDLRISHKAQQIILAAGIGGAAGLIGGFAGGAIGSGLGAWLGSNGICSGERDLIAHSDKAVSWLPYDPNLNSKVTYHCA